MVEILRRGVLGTLLLSPLLAACGQISQKVKEAKPTPSPTINPETQRLLNLIHQQVKSLAETYPENSLVRMVYLGDLSKISPAFRGQAKVGIAHPSVISRTAFLRGESSDQPQFEYTLFRDGSKYPYKTVRNIELAVYFSPQWTNTKNIEVKKIALEKEALNIALWERLSTLALRLFETQGEIKKLTESVRDNEIKYTLGLKLMVDDPKLRKLYDYAGYLAILPQVEAIIMSGDEEAISELKETNLIKIYNLAKEAGIPFGKLRFDSEEFLQMAFDSRSPWVKLINKPSVPGPA